MCSKSVFLIFIKNLTMEGLLSEGSLNSELLREKLTGI